MVRARRFPGRVFILSVLALTLFSSPAPAASDPGALESILQKIEARHYRWVAIRTEVLLFFAVSGNSSAMCGGELLYQRLDERIFLPCVDPQKNLVFVFRSLDRRFDLYLPAQRTIYHGSIFDMEDSPDIESHLKPRDLYRALKPSAFDPDRTEIERNDPVSILLNVYDKKNGERALERKIYLTPEGDVLGELYYGLKGQPLTQIQRYDFREIPAKVSSFRSIFFPKKITIVSPQTQKGSALFFTNVKALDSLDPLEFILRVPMGTREVFLDEKIPEFALRQIRLEKKTAPKTAAPEVAEDKMAANSIAEISIEQDADIVIEPAAPDAQNAAEVTPEEQVLPDDQLPEGPTVQYPEQKIVPVIDKTTTAPLTDLGGATIREIKSAGDDKKKTASSERPAPEPNASEDPAAPGT